MKLTKGMKKALSLLLTSALVITGANVSGGIKASAATVYSATLTAAADGASGTMTNSTGFTTDIGAKGFAMMDDGSEEPNGNGWRFFVANKDAKAIFQNMTAPTIEVTGGDITDVGVQEQVNWSEDATVSGKLDMTKWAGTYAEASWQGFVIDVPSGKTVSFKIYDAPTGGEETETPTDTPTDTPTGTPDIEKGDMNKFTVSLTYVAAAWGEYSEAVNSMDVTGNGDYTLTYEAQEESEDIVMTWLDTDLYNGSTVEGFSMYVKSVTIGDKDYAFTTPSGMTFCDTEVTKSLRYNIRNPYNKYVGDDYQTPLADVEDGVDAFAGATIPSMPGDTVKVNFTVSGMDSAGTIQTFAPRETPSATPTIPATSGATTAPGATTTATTAPGATTPAAATQKITVSAKSVIIAAGKSKTVKYTAKKATGASTAAVVKAKTSNSKVAKAKLVAGKKQVKISVPKKATKGATAKITLTSSKKKATITVKVQNKAKKVKAVKKVLIVKKGKKAKATFKVTAANKKKAVADKIKVTFKKKKVAKLVKTTVKKGKVIVSVKGLKKGKKTTMTVKIGKKSAKMTVKVKK